MQLIEIFCDLTLFRLGSEYLLDGRGGVHLHNSVLKTGILGHKMGSKDIQYETPINDGHLKKDLGS